MTPGKKFSVMIIVLCSLYTQVLSQEKTVGLIINDNTRTYNGYTLFAPKHNTMTYLIDNEGRIVHMWTKSIYEPGQSVYLLENGNLLRSCMTKGKLSTGGGEGGRIEEYDWNDNLVWEFDFSTEMYMHHHDIRPLPNGNVLLLAVEKITVSDLLNAGFDPDKFNQEIQDRGFMLPDFVAEVQPTRPVGGTIVWEWHVMDHLVQDYASDKNNYGNPDDHPELIDADGTKNKLGVFWNHMNSVNYNAALDQIILSVRGNSEIWVIDHGTTTEQSAGHSGGKYGKGGDLLYRWGNPQAYKAGNENSQTLFQQHDAQWIDADCPGGGNILVFNNGLGRNYSSVDEFATPVDENGNYSITAGAAFEPESPVWTYSANPQNSLYSEAISGAQRLPNGNTLICDGVHGVFLEVTSDKELVWKYINPVVKTGILSQGDTPPLDNRDHQYNAVFRTQRYPAEYPGLAGRNLTPGELIEQYATGINDAVSGLRPEQYILHQNYPNPFNMYTVIRYKSAYPGNVKLTVFNMLGQEVKTLKNGYSAAGIHSTIWDGTDNSGKGMVSGVYLYRLQINGNSLCNKLVLIK